jgi:hypothetical protein
LDYLLLNMVLVEEDPDCCVEVVQHGLILLVFVVDVGCKKGLSILEAGIPAEKNMVDASGDDKHNITFLVTLSATVQLAVVKENLGHGALQSQDDNRHGILGCLKESLTSRGNPTSCSEKVEQTRNHLDTVNFNIEIALLVGA